MSVKWKNSAWDSRICLHAKEAYFVLELENFPVYDFNIGEYSGLTEFHFLGASQAYFMWCTGKPQI